MEIGQVLAWERTFSHQDVEAFTKLSGDAGVHHVERDGRGRLMVQGLLTASMPTKIGGDINFIARDLNFQFYRPVYTGDTIRCEVTVTEITETEQHTHLGVKWICRNQEGKEVMTGQGRGVIRKEPAPGAVPHVTPG